KAAFEAEIDRTLGKVREWLSTLESWEEDPETEQLQRSMERSRVLRSWRRRLGEKQGASPMLWSMVTNLCMVFAEGALLSPDGAGTITKALDAPAEMGDLAAAAANLPRLKQLVKRARADDLRWATNAARTLAEYGEVLRRFNDETHSELSVPLQLTFPVGGDDPLRIAWLGLAFYETTSRHDGPAWDTELTAYRADLPKMRARLAMLEDFEPAERCYFGVDGVAQLAHLPEPNRDRIGAKARRWFAEHPDEARLLLDEPTLHVVTENRQ